MLASSRLSGPQPTRAPSGPNHRIGFLLSCTRWTDSNSFLLLYAYTAYFFASKMSRLIILLGPVAATLGGVTIGYAFDYLLVSFPKTSSPNPNPEPQPQPLPRTPTSTPNPKSQPAPEPEPEP